MLYNIVDISAFYIQTDGDNSQYRIVPNKVLTLSIMYFLIQLVDCTLLSCIPKVTAM